MTTIVISGGRQYSILDESVEPIQCELIPLTGFNESACDEHFHAPVSTLANKRLRQYRTGNRQHSNLHCAVYKTRQWRTVRHIRQVKRLNKFIQYVKNHIAHMETNKCPN